MITGTKEARKDRALPTILKAVRDGNELVRSQAAAALGKKAASEALPALIGLLGDQSRVEVD